MCVCVWIIEICDQYKTHTCSHFLNVLINCLASRILSSASANITYHEGSIIWKYVNLYFQANLCIVCKSTSEKGIRRSR